MKTDVDACKEVDFLRGAAMCPWVSGFHLEGIQLQVGRDRLFLNIAAGERCCEREHGEEEYFS